MAVAHMYLLMISLPDIDKVAMSLYDIIVLVLFVLYWTQMCSVHLDHASNAHLWQ